MEAENTKKLKKTAALAVFWVILASAVLGGTTFAWFTFSSATNVKPIAGTVGSGGAELLISSRYDGIYAETAELPVEGNRENLQPVSTADMKFWYTSAFQNNEGISTRFKDVTDRIDDMSFFGTVYLKSEGGSCDVYINESGLKIAAEEQLLACARLELIIQSETIPETCFDFNFDSLLTGRNLDAQQTVEDRNAVISSIDIDGVPVYVNDPSVRITDFGALAENDTVIPDGEPLFTAPKDEIITVFYRIYIEGCDEHAVNSNQNQQIELALAFAGIGKTKNGTAD